MNKKYLYLAFLVLVIIVGTLLIRTTLHPTAFAVKEPTYLVQSEDEITIDRSELTLCCELEIEGVQKGCWVLNMHECGYCERLCSNI